MITRSRSTKYQSSLHPAIPKQLSLQNQQPEQISSHLAQFPESAPEHILYPLFMNACIFQQPTDLMVEGLRYEQIQKEESQKEYLQMLRRNLPEYQGMNNQQKSVYFKKISNQYMDRMGNNFQGEKDQTKKKCVSFQINQEYVVFDKKQRPKQVKFAQTNTDAAKF